MEITATIRNPKNGQWITYLVDVDEATMVDSGSPAEYVGYRLYHDFWAEMEVEVEIDGQDVPVDMAMI